MTFHLRVMMSQPDAAMARTPVKTGQFGQATWMGPSASGRSVEQNLKREPYRKIGDDPDNGRGDQRQRPCLGMFKPLDPRGQRKDPQEAGRKVTHVARRPAARQPAA
jgi:hypothetical protein